MKKTVGGRGTLAFFLRDGISRGLVSFTAKRGEGETEGAREKEGDGLKERLKERGWRKYRLLASEVVREPETSTFHFSFCGFYFNATVLSYDLHDVRCIKTR